MTDTITLAQLSDAHLAPVPGIGLRHLNLKRGLGYLNWQRGRRSVHLRDSLDRIVADLKAHKPDHIAVTGDLINLGLPAEYEAARAWLHALGSPQSVTVVPGNHDIYTRVRGHPGVERWRDYMRADAWGAEFNASAEDGFPFVRRLGPVALIGLNSAVETPPFVAAGYLGAHQIAAAKDILERTGNQGLVRVVLIHHPPLPGQAPPQRALRDADAFSRMLAAAGADLVLHGHNHRDSLVELPTAHGRIPVLGLPSGSAGRLHKSEPLARYRLLRITRHDGKTRIESVTRGLDATGASVVEIDRKRLI
jgi:3',5'-cyclic AMP phosphodiesterase CpdA